MIDVQTVLFASLALSLLSAFLAMLGKQWLNRYASTDMRGSAIERSQSRQRKMDGIVAWYFNSVMESLPLMLQTALLLLGCALSRYLWDTSIVIASVVLAVTSLGLLFYIFIVVAGTASETCPYQTPTSRTLRRLGPVLLSAASAAVSVPLIIGSTLTNAVRGSDVMNTIKTNAVYYYPWWSRGKIMSFLKDLALEIPGALSIDFRRLGRAMIWALGAPPARAYHLARRLRNQFRRTPLTPEQRLDRQATVLDLRCISWTLQISLDKPVRLSSLNHLAMLAELTEFDPTLVGDCFNIFIGCFNFSDHTAVVIQGLEQLATVSATCFFRTFRRLSVMNPTSSILTDLRRRYKKVVRPTADFKDIQFRHTMVMIDALVAERWSSHRTPWNDNRPSSQEHTSLAQCMIEAAQVGYQRTRRRKVPRWVLRFALDSLSLDPPSPGPVVADCLTVVAIDLGCELSNIMTSDERYVCSNHISIRVLTQC